MTEPTTTSLPPGFEDFAPFLGWALPTQGQRVESKMHADFSEVMALYNLGMTDNRLVQALAYCDQFPLENMPADAHTLFLITLAMAEIRPQAEQYRTTEIINSVPPHRLPRSPQTEFAYLPGV